MFGPLDASGLQIAHLTMQHFQSRTCTLWKCNPKTAAHQRQNRRSLVKGVARSASCSLHMPLRTREAHMLPVNLHFPTVEPLHHPGRESHRSKSACLCFSHRSYAVLEHDAWRGANYYLLPGGCRTFHHSWQTLLKRGEHGALGTSSCRCLEKPCKGNSASSTSSSRAAMAAEPTSAVGVVAVVVPSRSSSSRDSSRDSGIGRAAVLELVGEAVGAVVAPSRLWRWFLLQGTAATMRAVVACLHGTCFELLVAILLVTGCASRTLLLSDAAATTAEPPSQTLHPEPYPKTPKLKTLSPEPDPKTPEA